jgi:hypothetical protein
MQGSARNQTNRSRLIRRTPQFILVNDSGHPQCFSSTRVSHHAAPAEEFNPCTGIGQDNPATNWRVRAKPRRRQQE